MTLSRTSVMMAQSVTPPEIATVRLLMCSPEHYGLKYEINPWMHTSIQPDIPAAVEQWRELYRTLTDELGCGVRLVSQYAACPDMVFTANAGLVLGDIALLSRFRHPERRLEEPFFQQWFEENGFRVCVPPGSFSFEGEGDALVVGDSILAGYLKRSDIGSHRWISETIGREVTSLELVDSRWYHLDTCLFALGPNLIAIYPGAFDSYGRQVLRNRFETIEVDEQEALRFACNSVVIGQHVVMPAGCPHLASRLVERGFLVHSIEMSEYMKAGGAAKCLTLFLTRAADYCLPAASPFSSAESSVGPSVSP